MEKRNEYRTTLVCVDSYEDGVLAGRFYNPCCPGESFQSLTQFLMKLDRLLDRMKFPQSFVTMRTFGEPAPEPAPCPPPARLPQEGRLATFAVRLLFRQNASWQGSVSWLEGSREERFRSALELVFLMDSALAGGPGR